MYHDIGGVKSTKEWHSHKLPKLTSGPKPQRNLHRYRDMEEDVDPEIGARQKVHQAPVDGESDFDSYRKVIQDASYKELEHDTTENNRSTLSSKPTAELFQFSDEKLQCIGTSAHVSQQPRYIYKNEDVDSVCLFPPQPSELMVPNGATLTFEDVTRRPLKSIPGSVLTFPRPNCSQSGVIYKQQITDAYGNIKVVPLLPRNDMTGAWMYLSKDGGICNYFADARVNAGVARVVWIPRDPNGSLNPQKHVLRALQSTNKFEIGLSPNYSAPTAGPELFEDLKWACADGQRFDSYDDARAYAFLLYATRCNDRNDGCASPGTRISLLSGSWESESADGTDGSTAGCEVKANANADALVDTEKPAYTNVDGYCYPKFRPSASLEDPMMELVHKNLDSRPTTEVHEDLSKSAYTNIDGYLYPNIWPATSLDEHEKESNESTTDSHATTEAHEDASKPAYTNIDGHVSPNFHPTTPLNGWKNQCGVLKAPESQAAAMSSLARRLRACVIDHSEWKSKTGEENFELYVKSDSHGGYGDYSHYALDGACDLLSRPCTPPPHPRGWKTEPDDGENHDSKEDSHVALEGADSAGLRYYTPPACGWKVETTEELYAFYANDHPKSCVVPPLSVSRNVSGDIAAQTSASHFERSGALSPENSSPDLSFSDANSFPGVQSATSPLNSNASVLESAAAGARASPSPIVEPLNPSDSVDWTPLMNDIANMLTKETVTEFKSDANVPVQSESGLQIAAHVPTCPGDTCSCVVCLGVDASSDSGKSDDTGIALSHVSSIASDSDDTPRCHFNKNLFGSNGWLDQTNIPKADTNRRVSSGRFKGLGQTVKAHIKDLTGESKRARITTANSSIAIETTAALSLSIETQVKLYAELEYLIVTTANRFLMDEYYDGHVSDLSIRRLTKEWISKNRPGVPQFCFDQSTQRELIFANRQSLKFGGGASTQPMLLHTIFSNWKAVCIETSVRSFCLPDAAVRKHLHDIEGILEMLQAPPSIMETMQTLAIRTREEILQVRAARTTRASYDSSGAHDAPSTPSTPSTPGSSLAFITQRVSAASSISRSSRTLSRTPRTPHSSRHQSSPHSCIPETPLPLSRDRATPFEPAGWTAELAVGRHQGQMLWNTKIKDGRFN